MGLAADDHAGNGGPRGVALHHALVGKGVKANVGGLRSLCRWEVRIHPPASLFMET